MTRRHLLQGVAASAGLWIDYATARPSLARIAVGFAAGGTLDVIGRRIADQLAGNFADSVIVDGRTGAGGRVAIDATKIANPDGTTIVLSPSSPIVIFPHVYKKLSYDPIADLVPITPVCSNAQTFVVGRAVPDSVRTLNDFIGWAKAKGTFYATPAAGSIMHFQGWALAQQAGIEMTHVPYRGMAAIVPDLLSGTVPTSMAVTGDIRQHVESGALRALAVTSARRSRFLPEVPTFAELGFDRVTGVDWYGLFAPAKTPQAIIDQLQQLVHTAMKTKSVADYLEQMGFDSYTLDSKQFTGQIKEELARWAPVVKQSGFELEN
jgi:tripartite-type tricarboxylate transporter receptor subunit TctC